MTTLDRAFIKAYHESAGGQAVSPGKPVTSAIDVAPRPTTSSGAPRVALVGPIAEEQASPALQPQTAGVHWPGATSELVPLSAYSSRASQHRVFRAMLEIDRISWPPACMNLAAAAGGALEDFADLLVGRLAHGQKCIAIASCLRGEGRTTVSLAAARQLAARGLKPAVVDADFDNPQLAAACGVATYTGWGEVLEGELPLGEAVIWAVEDSVALVGWRGAALPIARLAGQPRTAATFATLREHYDVLLVDAMPLAGQTTISDFACFAEAIHLDALYLVRDARQGSREKLGITCAKLRRTGLGVAGIVENFVVEPSETQSEPVDDERIAQSRQAAAG